MELLFNVHLQTLPEALVADVGYAFILTLDEAVKGGLLDLEEIYLVLEVLWNGLVVVIVDSIELIFLGEEMLRVQSRLFFIVLGVFVLGLALVSLDL